MALQTDYDLILLNVNLGDMTAQEFADKLSLTKPASVIMVLDHLERFARCVRSCSTLCSFIHL